MTDPEVIRALIVEDEPLARTRLEQLLRAETDVQVVGSAGEGEAAVEAIRALRPELVLLDVQIPRLDGFGVVERVGVEEMPTTIFVTAYDEHALRAFEVRAVDYLLKPFSPARLSAALRHARASIRGRRRDDWEARLRTLLDHAGRRAGEAPRHFMVHSEGRYLFIRPEDVAWFEASDNYVTLHVNGRRHLLRATLKSLAERLDPGRFVRIRASAIVNFDHVTEMRNWSGTEFELTLKDGTRLVTSRAFRRRLRDFFAGARGG